MAGRKSENKVKQTPILETESENTNAPDTDSVSKETTNETTPVKDTVVKSRRKTSLSEFAMIKNLRPEVIAGFKVWLNGELFHFDAEWDELLEKYQNRTLK